MLFPIHRYFFNQEAHFEFFTCSPSGLEFDSPNVLKGDFGDLDLAAFSESKVNGNLSLTPDFIMLYSKATPTLLSFFESSYNLTYNLCSTHYHTIFAFDNVGKEIHVLCKDAEGQGKFRSKEKKKPLQRVAWETH
jgi:hypothetical protein